MGGLGQMKIPILADTNHSVSKAYGCLKADEGIAFRGLYIIDAKGKYWDFYIFICNFFKCEVIIQIRKKSYEVWPYFSDLPWKKLKNFNFLTTSLRVDLGCQYYFRVSGRLLCPKTTFMKHPTTRNSIQWKITIWSCSPYITFCLIN